MGEENDLERTTAIFFLALFPIILLFAAMIASGKLKIVNSNLVLIDNPYKCVSNEYVVAINDSEERICRRLK